MKTRYMENMHDGFHKVHLSGIPDNPIAHTFTTPDHGDPHDHQFDIHCVVLAGGYTEEHYDRTTGSFEIVHRNCGDAFTVGAFRIHRIIALHGPVCVTLATYGPQVQDAGFYRWENGVTLYRPWHRTEFLPVGEAPA